jgi:hypothetical protein
LSIFAITTQTQIKLNLASHPAFNSGPTIYEYIGVEKRGGEAGGKKLNPWLVTGIADGEASFFISIFKDKDYKLG